MRRTSARATSMPRGRILVVDDEPDLRAGVATRMRSVGFAVEEAGDGPAALRAIREGGSPDVVILDVVMPGMDGLRVLEEIQRLEFPPTVILLTALGDRARRIQALRGGAHEFLTKPYDAEELQARIETAVRERARVTAAREEARTDPLTGIANRRVYEERIQAECDRARRYGRPVALVYVDADGLKRVNDTHGHGAGDATLRAIARALRATCRNVDVPARIGGDEFAAILPETDTQGAAGFLERFRRALSAEYAGRAGSPTAAAGFAVLAEGIRTAEDLRRAADESLYRDKRDHRSGT